MSFYNWLGNQKDRDDPVGDLANDAAQDKSFPRNTKTYEQVQTYLTQKRACPEALGALRDAWGEYLDEG